MLPLVALCLAVLMGFAGMAVDVGYWEYQQRQQQSAADGAALGGAQQLLYTTCPSKSVAQSAADGDATQNGYTNGSNGVTVTVNNPPSSGPYASDNCAVDVQITNKNVPTWFTHVLGFPNMPVTTEAVATLSNTNGASPCIWFLNPSQQNDLSNTHVDAPDCSIVMNDSGNFSNSTIDAAYIGYAAGTNNISNATFTEATPSPMLPVADPCAEIPGCAYLEANPPSTTGCNTGGTYKNTTISPGCYSTLDLNGGVTLNSGGSNIYTVNGSFTVSGANNVGSGVTIYLTGNAQSTNFSNAHLTLTAPTSGNTAGVALFRPGSQSAAVDMSNCTCTFTGLLYFPTSQVDFSNVGHTYTVLVVGQGNLSNSQNYDFSTPPPGFGSIGRSAVLAQ